MSSLNWWLIYPDITGYQLIISEKYTSNYLCDYVKIMKCDRTNFLNNVSNILFSIPYFREEYIIKDSGMKVFRDLYNDNLIKN